MRNILEQIDEMFEVVDVEDSSDDGSREILKGLKKEYNQLRVIELENKNRTL